MLIVQIVVVLLAILLGTRLKGIGLGVMGGLGLAVLTFCIRVRPASPPMSVLLIITAVVTASGTLEAAGGLRYLTIGAERIIRRYPQRITFVSPLLVYLLTMLGGTGHTIYAVLPVIADVAKDVGVKPSRPLSLAVIAAQQAVLASPISAPTVITVGLLAPYGVGLIDILRVCIPATCGGLFLSALVVNRLGGALHEGAMGPGKMEYIDAKKVDKKSIGLRTMPDTAKYAVALFVLGIALIMLLGVRQDLRPVWEVAEVVQPVDMPTIIAIMMLAIAAAIVLVCRLDTMEVVKSKVFTSGIQAVIAILGISWLGNTFIEANKEAILAAAKTQIMQSPWQFSIILFLMSVTLASQSATIRAILPLGLVLGLPATTLLAYLPAVNGLFLIPNYPTILAAIGADSTGTTRVGKWILNHSFMVPGLVATITAWGIAGVMVKLLF